MKKGEIIIAVLSILALVLNLFLIPGGEVLTVLMLGVLSCFYMYFSFALFNNIKGRGIFKKESYQGINMMRVLGAVGVGFAIALTIVGLLFKFQSFPGAKLNLGAGLVALLVVTVVSLIKYAKNKSEYYIRIFKRIAIFGGLGITVMLMPKMSWIELKYRNYPAYVEALRKATAQPDSLELWDNVKAERQKMYKETGKE